MDQINNDDSNISIELYNANNNIPSNNNDFMITKEDKIEEMQPPTYDESFYYPKINLTIRNKENYYFNVENDKVKMKQTKRKIPPKASMNQIIMNPDDNNSEDSNSSNGIEKLDMSCDSNEDKQTKSESNEAIARAILFTSIVDLSDICNDFEILYLNANSHVIDFEKNIEPFRKRQQHEDVKAIVHEEVRAEKEENEKKNKDNKKEFDTNKDEKSFEEENSKFSMEEDDLVENYLYFVKGLIRTSFTYKINASKEKVISHDLINRFKNDFCVNMLHSTEILQKHLKFKAITNYSNKA